MGLRFWVRQQDGVGPCFTVGVAGAVGLDVHEALLVEHDGSVRRKGQCVARARMQDKCAEVRGGYVVGLKGSEFAHVDGGRPVWGRLGGVGV